MNNMKDSGINYIGLVPDNWLSLKIKYLAKDKESIFIDGDWIESDIITGSGIRYLTTGNVGVGNYKEQGSGYISEDTFRELNCLKVLPGDLMISRLNEPIGRACIVPNSEKYYVVAVDNVIIRSDKKHCNRYLMYIMNTNGYAETGNMIARGSTMSRISRTQLGNMWVVSPPLQEQQAISDFLDEKCEKIDSIVSDLEKEIEILEKYKKSLITETVTKGLDKNVPMKDSSVEWIGEIPEHWEVKRLKFVCNFKTGTTPPLNEGINYDEDGYKWFTPGDYRNTIHMKESERYISTITVKSENIKLYPINSVLLVGIGATVGKVGIIKECAYSNQQITAMIPTNILGDYLAQFVYSKAEYIKDNALYTTLPIINNAYLSNIKIALPPITQQQQIIDFLDKKCEEINSTISTKEKQLETIKKYKQSLIYEYVTGKKRVAGFGGETDGN